MPKYEVVSEDLYKHKYWKPNNSFNFTTNDALCPLVIEEAAKVSLILPIAFSKIGDHFGLFLVQGLEPGNNYLVNGSGQWLPNYVPAAYRAYPFALSSAQDDQQMLCFDTDSTLLSNTEGHDFFDNEGQPSAEITKTLEFLSNLSTNQQTTNSLCELLNEMDLLEPWPITIKKDKKELAVNGLYRINETKFNSLEAEPLLVLRDKGALPIIFCQLISMQNLSSIVQWAKSQSIDAALPSDLAFDYENEDGNINFDGF